MLSDRPSTCPRASPTAECSLPVRCWAPRSSFDGLLDEGSPFEDFWPKHLEMIVHQVLLMPPQPPSLLLPLTPLTMTCHLLI